MGGTEKVLGKMLLKGALRRDSVYPQSTSEAANSSAKQTAKEEALQEALRAMATVEAQHQDQQEQTRDRGYLPYLQKLPVFVLVGLAVSVPAVVVQYTSKWNSEKATGEEEILLPQAHQEGVGSMSIG